MLGFCGYGGVFLALLMGFFAIFGCGLDVGDLCFGFGAGVIWVLLWCCLGVLWDVIWTVAWMLTRVLA